MITGVTSLSLLLVNQIVQNYQLYYDLLILFSFIFHFNPNSLIYLMDKFIVSSLIPTGDHPIRFENC